jgi:hypothetical protein
VLGNITQDQSEKKKRKDWMCDILSAYVYHKKLHVYHVTPRLRVLLSPLVENTPCLLIIGQDDADTAAAIVKQDFLWDEEFGIDFVTDQKRIMHTKVYKRVMYVATNPSSEIVDRHMEMATPFTLIVPETSSFLSVPGCLERFDRVSFDPAVDMPIPPEAARVVTCGGGKSPVIEFTHPNHVRTVADMPTFLCTVDNDVDFFKNDIAQSTMRPCMTIRNLTEAETVMFYGITRGRLVGKYIIIQSSTAYTWWQYCSPTHGPVIICESNFRQVHNMLPKYTAHKGASKDVIPAPLTRVLRDGENMILETIDGTTSLSIRNVQHSFALYMDGDDDGDDGGNMSSCYKCDGFHFAWNKYDSAVFTIMPMTPHEMQVRVPWTRANCTEVMRIF